MALCSIFGIDRHRIATDGVGVTTLVLLHKCPLKCKYCINPQCQTSVNNYPYYEPEDLYDIVKIDNLYFAATGGGVTFGGGEPAMQPDFIVGMRALCGRDWKLYIETSLNVPEENVNKLLPIIDHWYIDVKDMNSDIYYSYTGITNERVLRNLKFLADAKTQPKVTIRLPLIPDFNSEIDILKSKHQLKQLGFDNFDIFQYIKPSL
ncbi:MAG: radical SAM protein [Muribaculaceae bacterium]|nr:radical SAM protein [Muribaculaceae bacterium]